MDSFIPRISRNISILHYKRNEKGKKKINAKILFVLVMITWRKLT